MTATLKQQGFELIPIEKLRRAEWNYKLEDNDTMQALKDSVERNGVVETSIVRQVGGGKFEVINGNHRLEVYQQLGITHVPCKNMGKITEARAKEIAVQTNETKFRPNKIRLSEILNDMVEAHGIDEVERMTIYNKKELEAFRKTFLDEPSSTDDFDGEQEDKYRIKIKLDMHSYTRWKQWMDKVERVTGYSDPSKAFEMAIVEAMNIPDESLRT